MHTDSTFVREQHHFERLIAYHSVNSLLGGVCFVVNMVLLAVFLSYKPFRMKYQILIQLAVGDLINSTAIVLTGLNRIQLYSDVRETHTVPIRTPLDCAVEPWLVLKLIGDLLIPVTTLFMGVERFIAVNFPLLYYKHVEGQKKFIIICSISVAFVTGSMLVGFLIAWHINDDPAHSPAMYYCGRKAAFGDNYGSFIYITNILCNVVATALNLFAYIKAKKQAFAQSRMQRQIGLIKYYLIISLFSTLLVSLPNTIALFQIYVKTLSDSLSKPSYWAQTANSGIHLFVYLALNKEFRDRVNDIVRGDSSRKSHPLIKGASEIREKAGKSRDSRSSNASASTKERVDL